jgi:outer membrane lipoprotein carrier protein
MGQLIKVTGKDFAMMNNRTNVARISRCFISCFILLSAVFCVLSTVSIALSADDEIARIQKAYEKIKDVSGAFVQKSYIRDLKKTEIFKGQFFIKRPMMMKWEYGGDQPQEVVIKNGEITIYQKKEKQAFRSKFDRETYGQAPIALLSGFGNIRDEFYASEKNGNLFLKPRKPMGAIRSVEVEQSKGGFPIRAFTIIDAYQNRIEMTLEDVKVNTGLQDKVFELSLPKGVTVLEHNP